MRPSLAPLAKAAVVWRKELTPGPCCTHRDTSQPAVFGGNLKFWVGVFQMIYFVIGGVAVMTFALITLVVAISIAAMRLADDRPPSQADN